MTLDVQGDLRALITDVQAHHPERLTETVNQRWADDAAERLREYVGGGPVSTYLTARSGRAREGVHARASAREAEVSATGPGMNVLEEGTDILPGGVIKPRRGEYLTFRLHEPWDGEEATGRWIRTRQVRIKGRHMVRDAALQAADRLPDFLDLALEAV